MDTPDNEGPPLTADEQKASDDDVSRVIAGAATPQIPGSENERMLAMLIPVIGRAIEKADNKELKKVLDELRNFANPGRWVYRTVVWFLGLTALVTVVGVVWLVLCGKGAEIPDGLIALGSASIGALAGLLANRG
jgi:hypothetical protein